MTPNDLKSGYVVRLRSGEYAWVHSFSWFDIETGKHEELLLLYAISIRTIQFVH